MIAAIIAGAFLCGFIFGWALVPLVTAAAILVTCARATTWPVATLAVAACVLGVLRSEASRGHEIDASWIATGEITGQIAGPVIDDGRTQRFVLRTDDRRRLCARSFTRSEISRGDRIMASVAPDSAGAVSPGYAAYLRATGCDWSATMEWVTVVRSGAGLLRSIDGIRGAIATDLVTWAPGDAGALLAGLVVGDDSMLSDGAMDAFERTGTLHVVAISGSNLTLLVSVLLIVSAWSKRRGPMEVLALIVIWGYVLVGGSGPPTLRAGMLATTAAGARAFGRPTDFLTLSIQVAAIQALIWPSSVLGLSYRLSTAAIFGVLVAATGRSFAGWFGGIKLVFLTTFIVNLALLPILPDQSRPSILLSLLSNTAIAPLISLAFILGVLAVVLGSINPVFGESLAVVAAQVNDLTIQIVRMIAEWRSGMGPVGWDGSTAPTGVLYGVAIAVLLGASTEFRRLVRDLRRRAGVDETFSMLVLGSGLGACAGVLVVSMVR